MNRPQWGWIARPFRRAALPLAAYYTVTLALPVVNGAAGVGGFLDHALVVFLVPPTLILLGSLLRLIFHRNFPGRGDMLGPELRGGR